ncbi:MAG: nucleoside hydrolase, partial [Bacillota bacterium]|nr:nucleoside hydrolase [Bacillota bacterium]
MKREQLLHNLEVPESIVDAVLDTDTYNEVDDQFALSYMISSQEKINVKAIYAAPFFNKNSLSPKDGMEKSYNEILKILTLAKREDLKQYVFKGSTDYLKNEFEMQISPAAEDLAKRAELYSPNNPLYVVSIGAITNVASALKLNPNIKENIVIVWLGGHARDYKDTKEFNLWQDVAASRVVFGSGAPIVQLPCMGVVSDFSVTEPILKANLSLKNELCDYLLTHTIDECKKIFNTASFSKVIWDVTAVAWLLNDNDKFMESRIT